MKPQQVLRFIISVFLILAILGYVFPDKGVHLLVHLKFISPAEILNPDSQEEISLDDYLNNVFKNYQNSKISTIEDSLQFYIDFHKENATAISYPDSNMMYFDSFFNALDSSKTKQEVVRIIHYGDSQIEGDRISGFLREELQKQFGGMGFGLIPAIQIIPSMAVFQNYSGALTRYCMFGVEVPRASHRRYGLMAQMVMVFEQGSVSVSKSSMAYERGSQFTQVRLIFGHNQGPFSAGLTANGVQYEEKITTDSISGIKVFTWKLTKPATKANITMNGTAEIYGLAFDGKYGVTVDNIPMRGSAGTVFTAIDKHHLSTCYSAMSVKMIIMQFGGNVMPAISGQKSINWYIENIGKEIIFLKEANPEAVILFIGPSDMSKNIDGKMSTWPYLKEMNDALKTMANKKGIAYWDMFHAMGGENSMPQWVKAYPPLASTDYIHFTPLGAQTVAEMIYLSMMNDYHAYTLRQKIYTIQQDSIYKKTL